VNHGFLRSYRVRKVLFAAAAVTAQRRVETAFSVWRENVFQISPMVAGNPFGVSRVVSVPEGVEKYVDIHFHIDTGAICPSPEDLETLQDAQCPRMALMGIGKVAKHGGIEILFLEPSLESNTEKVIRLEERLEYARLRGHTRFSQSHQASIVLMLERAGIKTDITRLTNRRRKAERREHDY
jgi:hypothetical protein